MLLWRLKQLRAPRLHNYFGKPRTGTFGRLPQRHQLPSHHSDQQTVFDQLAAAYKHTSLDKPSANKACGLCIFFSQKQQPSTLGLCSLKHKLKHICLERKRWGDCQTTFGMLKKKAERKRKKTCWGEQTGSAVKWRLETNHRFIAVL